jgi:hypothetical protein
VGFALLAGLSLLAALAALAVTVRARLRGRAEQLVAATLLWNAIVVAPIYVLGLAGKLSSWSLALGSLLTSSAVLAGATKGMGVAALGAETRRALRGLLRLPADALALTWRARSLVFVGVAFAALLLPYLAISAYLGQALPHWDPLWYHDTMVGFTIQNHGFAMVDLPPTLQKVNGYVRLGEMTQLWMVIFADRRLADVTNLLFAPAIAASVYLLARRYAGAVIAIGWGVAVVVMPACANLLHSTYVDPQNAALLLGGVVFATLDSPRLRDAWLAALGLALAIGSKGLSLIPVPVAGAVGGLLLLRAHWHDRRRAALATLLGGGALIVAIAAITYLRNYLHFHNPFWPDMRVEVASLGIHWPGQVAWSMDPMHATSAVNLNEPLPSLLEHIYALPWTIKGMNFDQTVDYGIGVAWIALPLGAAAFVACLAAAAKRCLRWLDRDVDAAGRVQGAIVLGDVDRAGGGERANGPVALPLGLALILASIVAGSPALWGPRYHIAGVGLVAALCAWLTGRPPRDRLGESAVAAVLVTSVMMFYWTPATRWWFTPAQLVTLARTAPLTRELDRNLGAPTMLPAAVARERELTAGKLLVFNEHYAAFPSIFWNNHFSNRVMYLPGGPDFLARAAKAGATWVFLIDRDPQVPVARAPGSGWQEVGVLNGINGGSAYRRVPPGPPPPAKPPAPAPKPVGAPPPKPINAPVKPVTPSPKASTPPAPKPKGSWSPRSRS